MHARAKNTKLTPKALVEWRNRMGWTQQQMANALGVTRGTVAQYELGLREPPYYLGLALNWLQSELRGRAARARARQKVED